MSPSHSLALPLGMIHHKLPSLPGGHGMFNIHTASAWPSIQQKPIYNITPLDFNFLFALAWPSPILTMAAPARQRAHAREMDDDPHPPLIAPTFTLHDSCVILCSLSPILLVLTLVLFPPPLLS